VFATKSLKLYDFYKQSMYESLNNLKLSDNQQKVYLSLLKLHIATVSEISKSSGVYRSNCYDALNQLLESGLIGVITKDGKKYYEMADPENLKRLFSEQEQVLESEMPAFKRIYHSNRAKHEVQLYAGTEGIKTILKDINTEKSYDAFGISSNLGKVVPTYFNIWIGERYRLGLTARMVKAKSDKLLTPLTFGLKVYNKLFKTRNLPDEHYTPSATFIYGSKVAIILENIENPLGIIIENKEIAEGFTKQFRALWEVAKEEDLSEFKGVKPQIEL